MKRIVHVVGTRPNFVKIAPIMREMSKYPRSFVQFLVHTGQHYDADMSQIFLDELDIPRPDVNLGVGSGSHAWQCAQVMQLLEPALLEYRPDWVIAPGDVNSTFGSALAANKMGLKVAHVEAGLRSFDRTMPEEINRVLTDHVSDLLFSTCAEAGNNLRHEGIPPEKVHFVGNVMIDTLVRVLPKAEQCWSLLANRYSLDRYVLATLHRPANVDKRETLTEIVAGLKEIALMRPVLFVMHPRTRLRIREFGMDLRAPNMRFENPLGYIHFLALTAHADLVVTDSGGIQEETTYLGVPCVTVRPNTERPVTISAGTNRLAEAKASVLAGAGEKALKNDPRRTGKPVRPPELWDGKASERIVRILRDTAP